MGKIPFEESVRLNRSELYQRNLREFLARGQQTSPQVRYRLDDEMEARREADPDIKDFIAQLSRADGEAQLLRKNEELRKEVAKLSRELERQRIAIDFEALKAQERNGGLSMQQLIDTERRLQDITSEAESLRRRLAEAERKSVQATSTNEQLRARAADLERQNLDILKRQEILRQAAEEVADLAESYKAENEQLKVQLNGRPEQTVLREEVRSTQREQPREQPTVIREEVREVQREQPKERQTATVDMERLRADVRAELETVLRRQLKAEIEEATRRQTEAALHDKDDQIEELRSVSAQEIDRLRRENSKLQTQLAEALEEVRKSSAQVEEVQKRAEKANANSELRSEGEVARMKRASVILNEELLRRDTRIADLEKSLAEVQPKLEALQTENQRLRDRVNALEEQIRKKEDEIKGVEEIRRRAAINDERLKLILEERDLLKEETKEVSELEERNADLEEELNELNRRYMENYNAMKTLKTANTELEGLVVSLKQQIADLQAKASAEQPKKPGKK
eukprot:TRINITY_DN7480_c0_g2_i4.p1 TRINITY_DN7480_c0_g2~~TRINITY_DN7480_c0_g2_i4.p1  ORF type:complete len:549 (+),score=197.17 TRINITY_DN7480_c0_g2_i4:101-1648(+)